MSIINVDDKGKDKGAMVTIGFSGYQAKSYWRKELVMKGIANILIRDIGGFGFKSKNPIQLSPIPTGKPDLVVEE